MKIRQVRTALAVLAVAAAWTMSGCAHHVAPAAKATPPTATQTPLPEWAPKHPTPEFLRAAKVLKPWPQEQQPRSQAAAAIAARAPKTWPAAYQLFGSLSDAQIQHLLSAKELLIPVRSLTTGQHAALDGYLNAYREAFRGLSQSVRDYPVSAEDLVVLFYEAGAHKDLSNVDVDFRIQGHGVTLYFRIRPVNAEPISGFGNTFARM